MATGRLRIGHAWCCVARPDVCRIGSLFVVGRAGLGFIGGGVTPGYASCFGPPSANLALARRGLLAVVRLRRTFPACSLVRRLIADLIMFKKKPGDRLSIPPVVSVRRPMPSRTGGYHRSSVLGVNRGLPPRATLVRPPPADFPNDLVMGLSCSIRALARLCHPEPAGD